MRPRKKFGKMRMHGRLTPSHQGYFLNIFSYGVEFGKPASIKIRWFKMRGVSTAHDTVEITGIRHFKNQPLRF
jgi:hypothetical protein